MREKTASASIFAFFLLVIGCGDSQHSPLENETRALEQGAVVDQAESSPSDVATRENSEQACEEGCAFRGRDHTSGCLSGGGEQDACLAEGDEATQSCLKVCLGHLMKDEEASEGTAGEESQCPLPRANEGAYDCDVFRELHTQYRNSLKNEDRSAEDRAALQKRVALLVCWMNELCVVEDPGVTDSTDDVSEPSEPSAVESSAPNCEAQCLEGGADYAHACQQRGGAEEACRARGEFITESCTNACAL